MPRFDTLENNFTAGVLSPLLLGRTDFARYQNGAEDLVNWLVLLQGGLRTRYGTRYGGTAKTSSSAVRVLPFEPSASQAYVIEAGNLYFRFYTNSARLESGGSPIEVTTPYTSAQLFALRTAQSNDVMIIAHGSHAPRRLSRLTTTSFRLNTIAFSPPPTFIAGHDPAATLTPSAVSGTITLTASATAFYPSDVQRIVSSGDARAVITAYTSGTAVTAEVLEPFADLSAIAAGEWTIEGTPVARLDPDVDGPVGGQITLDLQKQQDGATELVTNGDFASDLTGWTVVEGAEITTGWHDGSSVNDDLLDSSQDFGTAGIVAGHKVRNISDGSEGVAEIVDTTRITLDPNLAGGADNKFDGVFISLLTGTDNSGVADKATSMVDTTTNFVTAGVLVGMTIKNTTDGSEGVITSITTTTNPNDTINFSGGLSGGAEDDFDNGDAYDIGHPGDRYEIRSTGTAVWDDGKGRITGGTSGVGGLRQQLTTVDGTYYRLQFDIASAKAAVMVGSTAGASDIASEASYDIGNEHEIIFQATGAATWIEFRNNQNTNADVDNVSCKIYSINGFRPDDVGKYIKIHGGLVKITSVINAMRVQGEIVVGLSTDVAAGIGAWSLESASWSDALGWPRVVVLYEGRLAFASSATFPQTIWLSAVDDLFNFFVPNVSVTDEDAAEYTLRDSGGNIVLNQIRSLMPAENMLALTTRAEYRLVGPGDDPLSSLSLPRVRVQSTYGSDDVQPIKVGPALLFAQRQGSAVREMAFQEPTQGYISRNLTRLSGHLLKNARIVELTYQAEPAETGAIVWAVRSDGTLLGLTYDLVEQVEGWHPHTTDGSFESVACIPHESALSDQVWLVVNRTINGTVTRTIEYFDNQATMTYPDGAIWQGLTVDGGVTYDASAGTTLTGLGHLEGKTVAIVVDGAVHPPKVVSGGQVTLDYAVQTTAWAGLPFTCTGKTLPIEMVLRGTVQRQRKTFVELAARVYQTVGLKLNGEQVSFRAPGMAMNQGPPPQTADYDLMPPGGWDNAGQVNFVQEQPLPATLLGIIGVLDVSAE